MTVFQFVDVNTIAFSLSYIGTIELSGWAEGDTTTPPCSMDEELTRVAEGWKKEGCKLQ